MTTTVIEIDGNSFSTLEGFCDLVWPIIAGCPHSGNANLDAFNDILSWPEESYIFRWKNSKLSQKRLDYSEMVRKLEKQLNTCHFLNRENVSQSLKEAKKCQGADNIRLACRNYPR
jgi:hypothetical protein